MSTTATNNHALPCSEQAERGVLGCLLLSPSECLAEVRQALDSPDAFYDLRHRTIYETMLAMDEAGEAIDSITLQQRLRDRQLLDGVGGLGYLSSLPDEVPSAANLGFYLELLLEKFAARQLFQAAREVSDAVLAGRADVADLTLRASDAFNFLRWRLPGAQTARPARPLGALIRHERDDPDELLRHRFLCRGGGLNLYGPTGIGKSSLALQLSLSWAIGRELFGIAPAHPLKSLFIQAENDDGDLAEMRDGVLAGLQLTPVQSQQATAKVIVVREDERVGAAFFARTVGPLLQEHQPDLLWIDPALAFLGGETNSQRDVGAFLRSGLNPLLRQFRCGSVIVHHTNKPPQGQEKPNWAGGDFAYLGSGSAEWANWARAVLALRSLGTRDVFELRAAKRGARLGWTEADGSTRSYVRYLAHAREPGLIYWREVHDIDLSDDLRSRRQQTEQDDLLTLLPPEGLTTAEWTERAQEECGLSRSAFFRLRKTLATHGRVLKSRVTDRWQPILQTCQSQKSHQSQETP